MTVLEQSADYPAQLRRMDETFAKASRRDQVLLLRLPSAEAVDVVKSIGWLDREFRRAARIVASDLSLERVSDRRPLRPLHPSKAGLRVTRTQSGSFSALLDFYGELEQFAANHPLLLGALVAAAGGTRSLVLRMTRRKHEDRLRAMSLAEPDVASEGKPLEADIAALTERLRTTTQSADEGEPEVAASDEPADEEAAERAYMPAPDEVPWTFEVVLHLDRGDQRVAVVISSHSHG